MSTYQQTMPMYNGKLKQELLEVQIITPQGGKFSGKRVMSYALNGIPKASVVVAADASLEKLAQAIVAILELERG